jgi:hypothetical protein
MASGAAAAGLGAGIMLAIRGDLEHALLIAGCYAAVGCFGGLAIAPMSAGLGASIYKKPVIEICEAIASKAIETLSKAESARAFAKMGAVGGAILGAGVGVAGVLAIEIWAACRSRRAPATAPAVPSRVSY